MKIVIIGNGISGATAARWLRKLGDHEITMISAESDYFYSRTALMYIYMGHMRLKETQPYENWFWEKNRINLLRAWVSGVDFDNKKIKLRQAVKTGASHPAPPPELEYDKLIIATGSATNKFGWPGQDLNGAAGLYTLQDLQTMNDYSKGLKRAVIVGGGLIGIEMAEMFHSRNIPVTFLVREKSYWNNVLPKEESEMINRCILNNHIDLRLGTELKEIVDDGNGQASAVITNTGERINCGFVGLTAGVHPNINFLRESELEIGRGIKVNEYLETNIPDVYAIGDCAEQMNPIPGRRGVEAIWYTGRMMGENVAYNIYNKKIKYNPGIWFNSAKFFDIEYQVYGNVQAHPPENHESLYWEHSDGDKSIRIIFDKKNKEVLGFNLMGIRYRHEVCEKWLAEKTNIETVLQELGLANFDPEFFDEYDFELIKLYNQKTGSNLQLKKKRGLDSVISFLKR